MEEFKEKIKDCLQDEPAFCTASCPFGLDVRDFIGKIQRGGFNAAYRSYLNTVGFPNIVAELCGEPCKKVCPRGETDSAINMKLLEKAVIAFARNLDPNSYNVPTKNKKIAIIGAGISGLACALRLASKKYEITVFEKTERIGGTLWAEMPSEVFLADIERQFKNEEYKLCLNTEITSLENLDFDAIYIATGKNGTKFGLERDLNGAFASNRPGVFLGGQLEGRNLMESIADGLKVINAIERYIKTGNMNQPGEKSGTRIKLDPRLIAPISPVMPSQGETYSQEEGIEEAKRCLKCTCDACVRHCDLMGYYSKFPRRIGEEVEITINPGTLDGNGTVATRLISTCTHCGLCKEICPENIDTGEFLLQSHQTMQKNGAMPWAFHDFWLRDMDFSNGESAALCKIPAGYEKSEYMFFPGCQLGGSDPRYVTESYNHLLRKHPSTAIMLQCCGAQAEWSGDEPLREETLLKIKENWIALGKPKAIFACPSCFQIFKKYLPEIKGEFLYSFFQSGDFEELLENRPMETVSVFDPCSSKYEPELQKKIRELVENLGYRHKSLSYEGSLAKCCSWGGHVSTANKVFSQKVVQARISENSYPYIAYCVNCRDIFSKAGKECYHILDLIFGLNNGNRTPPTLTERRENRVFLKKEILRAQGTEIREKIGLEHMSENQKPTGEIQKSTLENIHFAPGLKEKISDEMSLEEDIIRTVEYCEKTGKKIRNKETGTFAGHHVIGCTTYWVEYEKNEQKIEILKAYSHRMTIEED